VVHIASSYRRKAILFLVSRMRRALSISVHIHTTQETVISRAVSNPIRIMPGLFILIIVNPRRESTSNNDPDVPDSNEK
jgi:hypothetical protein